MLLVRQIRQREHRSGRFHTWQIRDCRHRKSEVPEKIFSQRETLREECFFQIWSALTCVCSVQIGFLPIHFAQCVDNFNETAIIFLINASFVFS